MESSSRFGTIASTVKCSFCAVDIEISAVADHECQSATHANYGQQLYGNLPLPNHQPYYERQQTGTSPDRENRPLLPKLDSSITNRSGLNPSEAANIAHDLGLPSPLSAGSSGRKSPHPSRSRSRRAAAPRSPSPDGPVSQDCAFPAFPMTPKRLQQPKEGQKHKAQSTSRSTTSTKMNHHSSSQSTASSLYSTGSVAVKRKNTSSSQRSRPGTRDDSFSSSSNVANSPRQSNFPSLSREQSIDQANCPPGLVSSHSYNASEPSSSISTMPPTPSWPSEGTIPSPKIFQLSNSDIGWAPTENAIPEEQFYELEQQKLLRTTRNKLETSDRILAPGSPEEDYNQSQGLSKEPSYKSKRPAPLLKPPTQGVDDPAMPRSARAAPTPPTHGGLKRTLTNLFGRKQSQPSVAKIMALPTFDSPRMRALAPDPPDRLQRGEMYWDDVAPTDHTPVFVQQDPGLLAAQTLTNDLDNLPGSHLSRDHQESPRSTEVTTEYTPDKPEERLVDFGDKSTHQELGDVHSQPGSDGIRDNVQAIANEDDMRRASVDSASSYGSIGFSNRTASSRSSHPTSDDPNRKIAQLLDINPPQRTETNMSPPKRPYLQESIPESPTDPSYSAGKLAPIMDSSARPRLDSPDSGKRPHAIPNSLLPTTNSLSSPKPFHLEAPAAIKGQCRGCSHPIIVGQKSMSSADGRLTGKYHKECFVCWSCKEHFATTDFYVFDDHPYCGHHYHVLNNTLCAGCNKGIEGEYQETFDVAGTSSKKFHSKCLQCSTCKAQLSEDYFEFHGKVYCEKDAFRAASGPRNPYDTIPARPSPLVREYINSGEPGLKGRFPERRTTRLIMT